MKVILLEDVYKQGVAGDMVNVAPGYARNYLIPQGLAVKATPGALRQLETLRESAAERRAIRDDRNKALAEKIEGMVMYFPVKAGETGKLYGSVTSGQIGDRLVEEVELDIDRRRIGDRPLRELGSFDVPVRLSSELAPKIQVIIYPEDADPEAWLSEFNAQQQLYEAIEAAEEAETEEETAELLEEAMEIAEGIDNYAVAEVVEAMEAATSDEDGDTESEAAE